MNGNSIVDYQVAAVDHMFTVTGLSPNTEYKVTVTLEVHGGATATSDVAVITTPDGGKQWKQFFKAILFCTPLCLSE